VAVDRFGNVWAVGYAYLNSPTYRNAFVVRKRDVNTGLWSSTSEYIPVSSSGAYATGVTTDSSGNVYVSGYYSDSSGLYHHLVRKWDASGSAWSTVEDYQQEVGYNAQANSITTDSSGNIYSAGYAAASTYTANGMVVRKWNPDTLTSSTVGGAYQLAAGYSAQANSITIDTTGNIWVAGYATDASSKTHFIVRKWNGASWSTVDDYQLVAGYNAQANSVTADASGNIYVAGSANDALGLSHAIIRKWNGQYWSTINNYVGTGELPTAEQAATYGIFADRVSGKVYSTGYLYDGWGYSLVVEKQP
jgi:hypothetical protein